MQYVEDRIGNAAAQWGRDAPRRRSVPLSLRPETGNSSTSHQSHPIIRVDVVGLGENDPHQMQEFYPPPSPIFPGQHGSFSEEAMINRLDGVSPQDVRFAQLDVRFRFWNEVPSPNRSEQEY